MNRIIKRLALPLGAAAILGTSGFAYMAANNQSASSLGSSTAAVTGYDVNSIHYNACTPMDGNFCSVQFLLKPQSGDAPANTGTNVQASINGAGYTTCIYNGAPGSNQGTEWVCYFKVPAAQVTSLSVSAAQ